MPEAETKWTPGPWEIRGFGGYIPLTNKRIFEASIAWRTSEEARANAHLIAAAPDLYEAIDNWLSYLESDDLGDLTLETVLHNAMRTVLAKARGESQ